MCLQVNPYSYIKYRGQEHEMTEEQYNESIYNYCIKQHINYWLSIMEMLINQRNSENIYHLKEFLYFQGSKFPHQKNSYCLSIFREY